MKQKIIHDNKCKVLHLVYVMGHGGIETFLMSMLRSYDRERFHMDIAYCGPSEGAYADQVRSLGSELIKCKMRNSQVGFVCNLYKILKHGGYHAFNSHLSDMGGGAIWAAKMAKIPARVASYHTNLVKRTGLRKKYLEVMRHVVMKNATNITTSSPDVTDSHFADYSVDPSRVHPISYGVDVARFSQQDVRPLDLKQYGINDNDMIIGHVGRYVPQKNHMAIVEIAAIVTKQIPNAKFILCGKDGGLKEDVQEAVKARGLEKHFAFVSGIEDMRSFYKTIDLFILPSMHEGMPISIIESQASGVPLVASRLGGIEIATAEQMNQNLFPVNEIESFSECVISLLRDKPRRLSLGALGYEYVKETFDISVAVRKYESLYFNQSLKQ